MRSHLDPSLFKNANQIAALTFNPISISNAVIHDYPVIPAVPHSAFPDLLVFENLSFAFGTFYYYHL